jgi:hypothetical protein
MGWPRSNHLDLTVPTQDMDYGEIYELVERQ